MYKINLIIACCMLLTCQVLAQFNDSTHYHANLISTGSINRATNVNTYLLNNAFTFGVKQNNLDINANNTWVYGRSNNALTNDDYSAYVNVDLHTHLNKFYYWSMVNYNTSFSLKITGQLLTGGGLAYNIIDDKKKNDWLNISDGVLYDKSDLILGNNVHDVYYTFRNSLRLQFRFVIAKLITVNSSTFLQNSFIRASDYIFRTNNSANLKLNKWLNFTAAFNYNNENRTVSQNLLFTYGLTFDRYF